jgi:UDP-N-acetylglucosamine 2-epimerase (non-hydrolysing)
MRKLLFVFGTRPEAIKMAPIILECRKLPEILDVKVCLSGQHREMLQQVMDFFGIGADYNIDLMRPGQTLFDITAGALTGIEPVLEKTAPDVVLVQGDTTTAFAGALAAYYKKIKIAHVEAGLRSGNKYSPFPEEINRKLIGSLADLHFTPTSRASDNLRSENVSSGIYEVGNTVIDALLYAVDKIKNGTVTAPDLSFLNGQKRLILVTGHRRESFGRPFEEICDALAALTERYPDIEIVYPVHLNPNVQEVVRKRLGGIASIHLIPPVEYPQLVALLDRCYFVITDSGGIQEEAPALGKPVLVIRDVTERTEGIEAGTAVLVGTSKENIIFHACRLLDNRGEYDRMARSVNPYGDGTSARKIRDILIKDNP